MDQFTNTIPKLLDFYLVEDAIQLNIGQIKKSREINAESKIVRECQLQNIGGSRSLSALLSFSAFNPDQITIGYSINGLHRAQSIRLEGIQAGFGERKYFICQCGYQANTLYLRDDFLSFFGCRSCLRLRYELTTFNRNTGVGKLLYLFSRKLKLMRMRENFDRLIYAGRATRKAASFIAASRKWEMTKKDQEKIDRQLLRVTQMPT